MVWNSTKLYQPVTYSAQLLSSQVHQIEAILETMMDMGPSLDQITKITHHNQNQTVIMRSMYRLWKKADPNILKSGSRSVRIVCSTWWTARACPTSPRIFAHKPKKFNIKILFFRHQKWTESDPFHTSKSNL